MIIQLHKGKSLISRLIRMQTRGQYSHASIAIDDGLRFEAKEFKGVGFSSQKGNEDIDYFYVHLTTGQQRKCIEFLNKVNGAKYDYKMVARFLSRRSASRDTKDKFFCSELVFDTLASVGILLFNNTEGWEVSPQLICRSTVLEKIDYEDIDFVKDTWDGSIVEQLHKRSKASK